MSRGTAVSLAGAALEPMFAYRDGALRTMQAAERTRSFRVDGQDRTAGPSAGPRPVAAGGRPGCAGRRVRRRRRAGRAGHRAVSALTAAVTRVPGIRTALRVGAERIATLLPAPAPDHAERDVVDRRGDVRRRRPRAGRGAPQRRQRLRVHRRFLALAAARAAHAAWSRGAMGPVEAFGLDLWRAAATRRGCGASAPLFILVAATPRCLRRTTLVRGLLGAGRLGAAAVAALRLVVVACGGQRRARSPARARSRRHVARRPRA